MDVGYRFLPVELVIFGVVIEAGEKLATWRPPMSRFLHIPIRSEHFVVVIEAAQYLVLFGPPMSRPLKTPIYPENPWGLVGDLVLSN